MLPVGTQDPTPFLYDSTCMAATGLLSMAAISNAMIRPTDLSALLVESEGKQVAEIEAALAKNDSSGDSDSGSEGEAGSTFKLDLEDKDSSDDPTTIKK